MPNPTTATRETRVAARGYEPAPPSEPTMGFDRRAVIYLRVSTASQVNTDRDGEGFSIPAQREACIRKAESLGALVVAEFIDAGESARSSDREQLQAMLGRLLDGDVDYVIVHKVDRLARNRADDVEINLAIRKSGAQLVSVSENIDETPSGMLLHGIMSSIAEFYSQNLATEIKKGMTQKAKKGGFPHKAPVGYLNVREVANGHEIRTLGLDPDRAENVRWAFDAYASGDYSLLTLTEALEDRGLTTKPTPRFPAKPLAVRHVHNMLRNRFYVGLVKWGEAEYPGQHEALIDVDTFVRVQATLESRGAASEKQRTHLHYLKGSIYCARCQSRLSFTRSKGRSGQSYDYFFCIGRHQRRTGCDLAFLPVDDVEDAVARSYSRLELSATTVERLRDQIRAAMAQHDERAGRQAKRERLRIRRLENERRTLLQAHLSGAVPVDLLKEEQDRIARQIGVASAGLERAEVRWATVEANLEAALTLAGHVERAYVHATEEVRRQINQAIGNVNPSWPHRARLIWPHLGLGKRPERAA